MRSKRPACCAELRRSSRLSRSPSPQRRRAPWLCFPRRWRNSIARRINSRLDLPAPSALEVFDLSTGYHMDVNAGASMPAASTIKIPVMVEVFAQLQAAVSISVTASCCARAIKTGDRASLCDARPGTSYRGFRADRKNDRHQRQYGDEHADPAGRTPSHQSFDAPPRTGAHPAQRRHPHRGMGRSHATCGRRRPISFACSR